MVTLAGIETRADLAQARVADALCSCNNLLLDHERSFKVQVDESRRVRELRDSMESVETRQNEFIKHR